MFEVNIMTKKKTLPEVIDQEELVLERIDEQGNRWVKKYVGGGEHFANWLEQYKEVYGEECVETEEVDSCGFSCFEIGKEKMFRIWVKEFK